MSKVSLKMLPSRITTRSGRPSLTRRVGSNRTGTIYLAVLGVALIVGALSATAIHVARIELHKAVTADEMARTRLAAQSGIEYAISVINSNADWRTEYQSGVPVSLEDASCTLTGTGEFSFTLTDSDDDLADDENDAVTLQATGVSGNTKSIVEVLLAPTGLGLDCLDSALHAEGQITLDANLSMYRVSSNSTIEIKSPRTLTVTKDVWAMQTISGTVNPTTAKIQYQPTAREMPDPESVFEYYKSNGTWISLPSGSIEEELLSPNHNPYGSETNTQGIYIVDCGGVSITLRECRIVGTLVLLHAGAGTRIKDCILMEPAVPNFPALLVEGPLEMDWDYTTLISENGISINLNPFGLPIGGLIDGVLGGSWPGEIKGLIYLTGNLVVKNKEPKINGVIVAGGTVNVTNRINHTHDATTYLNPPPGFAAGSKMKIVPGTWKRAAIANP
jgi:hypothetical protein